jgi:hypothetical protein
MEEYPVSREYTASKLPTYRSTDLSVSASPSQLQLQSKHAHALAHAHVHAHLPAPTVDGLALAFPTTSTTTTTTTTTTNTSSNIAPSIKPKSKDHVRNHSASSIATPKKVESPKRRLTLPSDKVASPGSLSAPLVLNSSTVASASTSTPAPAQKARNFPVAHRRNGLENSYYPPRSFITQRSMKDSSTTDWVAQQSIIGTQPATSQRTPTSATSQPSASVLDPTARPLIKPIRGFKPSSRKSADMASRRISVDTDNTLRALEGYNNSGHASNQPDQDEHNSDDSDLFLRAAREEELARQSSNSNGDGLARSDSRKVSVSILHAKSRDMHPHLQMSPHVPSFESYTCSLSLKSHVLYVAFNLLLTQSPVTGVTTCIYASIKYTVPPHYHSSSWLRSRESGWLTIHG